MTMPVFAEPVSTVASPSGVSSGARLVASDGRALPLARTSLVCEAGGGVACSVLRQRFFNDGPRPLEVTYLLPLPSDGAVSGYSFTLDGVVTCGKVEPQRVAREHYEQALLEGKSAALLDQDRSSVFRQAIGNIPPGAHIDLEVSVDHPLTWLEGAWELRFPTVVAPRYQSGNAAETSATVAVALPTDTARFPTHEARVSITDRVTGSTHSPSHALVETRGEPTQVTITRAQLDRDLVLRWPVATPDVGVRLETARLAAGNPRSVEQLGLLTLVPPHSAARALPRDLIVLLDTSGSMAGEPLAQSVRITSALVRSLNEQDSLELIEFSTSPRRWRNAAVPTTEANKRDALDWLQSLSAGGGTEMRSGIEAALATLRPGALRQVILVSDGLIGFEQQVLRGLLEQLPESCRFHSVGVGHATNGSLLQPAARIGRGAAIVVAPGEDVEPACARLLARTAQPLVVNLRISGTALAGTPTTRLPDLYRGAPALLPVALRAEGGTLEIRGETADAAFNEQVTVPPREAGSGSRRLATLYARECVEALELRLTAYPPELHQIEPEIERLGVDFQIATRLTSWVAVSKETTVDGSRGSRRFEQPQQLPAGMSAEGLGLRSSNFFAAAPMLTSVSGAGVMRSAPEQSPPAFYKRRRTGSGLPPLNPTSPVASAAPPPARSQGVLGSFIERVKNSLGGGEAEPLVAGSRGLSPEGLDPTVRVKGRVRIDNEARLALAIELPDASQWLLPERVLVTLADGTGLVLLVEKKLSTPSGPIAGGLEIQLVFTLERKLTAAVPQLVIEQAGEPRWVVEVTA